MDKPFNFFDVGQFMLFRADESYTKHALDFTDHVVKNCPGRGTGTEALLKSTHMIKNEYAEYCGKENVEIEEFDCHPRSFFGYFGYMALIYIVSAFLIYFNILIPALLAMIAGAFTIVTQFIYYRQYIDFLFPKAKGYNIIGTIKPLKETKQRIIVSGHHDAGKISHYIDKCPRLYQFIVAGGIGTCAIGLIVLIVYSIGEYAGVWSPEFQNTIKILWFLGIPLVLPFFRFTRYEFSPGAGDNLIAVAIAGEVARIITDERQSGNEMLQHTELKIISFDAEEAGVRGSRDYCEKHEEQLKSTKTYVFNMDSIFYANEFHFFSSDLNGLVKCSEKMARECTEIAHELGYPASVQKFPFGGGATDSASFGEINVETTNLIAMKATGGGIDNNTHYHTPRDTIDVIEPDAVKRSIDVIVNYVIKKEEQVR